ncbi:hypothetical protein [Geminicoccus roseus]|uniref:hypothetical protein n=1 Tax=Geminicoccus roseus TaxID=404900 RepID=UPI0004896810|nr:hypothetical protein [Geminicoccus roseus]
MRRILADPGFQASAARRRLLEFIVEETLAGRGDQLKGFTIAVAVFARDQNFDPQSDPVVRVEARRLRRDLHSYYDTAGKQDPVILSIPKGGYVPSFEDREVEKAAEVALPPKAPERPWPQRRWLMLAPLVVVVLLALAWSAAGPGRVSSLPEADATAAIDLPRGPRIAVAPFLGLGDDPEQAYLAQGITEEIVTDLARFRALFVLPLQRSADAPALPLSAADVSPDLEVDYLLTGSVQRQNEEIRLMARLIDTRSGGIVWAEPYRSKLTPSNIFDIQEDISDKIVATLAGSYGIIAEEGQTEAQRRPPGSLAAYECLLRYYHYQKSFDRQEHAEVRGCLERAVELEPDYADAWAVLANIYAQEYRQEINPRPELYDARERSLAAARRGVEIEPRSPVAQLMLSNALFDRDDIAGFRMAGERALTLNPNDPDVLAHFGTRLVYMGEWEDGRGLVGKAIMLNPDAPGWYRDPLIYYSYQKGDYDQALREVRRSEVPRMWLSLFRAMILGQLDRNEEAQPYIEVALALNPTIRERFWTLARVWKIPDPHIEHMADGLRKAGLAILSPPPG